MKKPIKYLFCGAIPVFLFIFTAYAEKTSVYLQYENENVRLDIYDPGKSGCPVAILIHGAAGIEGDRATRYERFASELMNSGIIAINVHYFDSSRYNWIKTIEETINYAQNIPDASKDRIGLIGYSLGGTIALEVASKDKQVKLLALNAGFLPPGFNKEKASSLPTTLIISGSDDPAMDTLETLSKWLAESGRPFKTKINPGIGHDNVPLSVFNEDWSVIREFFKDNL